MSYHPAMTKPSAPPQKRVRNPDAMRNRLLDVAAEAFQSLGYHNTSMHDVMRNAKATGGAVYHHFPSKKALGLAVIRERVAKAVEETWIEPVKSARVTREGILAVFDQLIAELDRGKRILGCPLNNLALELSLADPEFQIAIQEVIEQFLDEAFICHVGFVVDGEPFVIPTSYARIGDRLVIHGSQASRMMYSLEAGVPVCVTVLILDGLVLARSAFDHSMNYRSVVMFGRAFPVKNVSEKRRALRHFSEHICPGRWAEVRKPNDNELKATWILA